MRKTGDRSKRKRKPESLGQAIAGLIKDLGIEHRLTEQSLISQWPELVGEKIARHTRAVICEGGKLFVEVDSAAWRHELVYMKAQIVEKLNREAGSTIIQEIILTNRRR
ncbi:MAG: DUF721 domain-containing protein [Candidatus Latescibacteria bacterium]|jgi:predicted nucleic acid-binding Zn ribbon protein|nr:DUF721 domain-containing protein [Candidatus Latescibacterota bacterium]